MKKRYLFNISIIGGIALTLSSCLNDLDRKPEYDVTPDVVYQTPTGYKQALAKVYGSFASTGNQGPAGKPDIGGIDEGTSDFLRMFWISQELSTDEAVCGWGDPGIPDFHNMNWSSDNPILKGLYNRIFYQITLTNEFIRESSDDKLASRGISGADATEIKYQAAEARFLRAFQYWVAIDLYGNVPFIDETSGVGSALPKQISRADLFNYVESELKALEGQLKDPKTNEYGRADKAAAWALLARLYLNAEVYTGKERYADAAVYAKKVIDAGYSLVSPYKNLFVADNNVVAKNEIILSINYDADKTRSYGGTTYLVNASVGGDMNKEVSGTSSGWGGNRTTKNLPLLFPTPLNSPDKRAMFVNNSGIDITKISEFKEGYASIKFKNAKADGSQIPNVNLGYSDTDFPLFRLGEMYMIYAEASFRKGDAATAVQYINLLRARAYQGTTQGQITSVTLDEILNERGRELYWEGFRRSDLIRFGKFISSTYLWPWKGGVLNGTGVADFRKLYPLPSSDVTANPNLTQNTGY